MKEVLGIAFWGIIIYIIYSYFVADSTENNKYKYSDSYSNTYSSRTKDCSTLEPENPYSYGSGHYAGFQWGERGNYCSGNSQSFIEGCEEYERQDEIYTQCENNN